MNATVGAKAARKAARRLGHFSVLDLCSQPIGDQCADERAKYSESARDDCKPIGGYVFQGTRLQFLGALFGGFLVAVAFIAVCTAIAARWIRTPNVKLTGTLRRAGFGLGF